LRQFKLSPVASTYVRAEARYLKIRSPAAAWRFQKSLNDLKRNLLDFPGLGHPSTETNAAGVHRFVMNDYLIDYEVVGEVIRIIDIRHGRQMPPNRSIDSDDDFEVT
jgi:plasmid stabilization system protein ParE